MFAPVKKAKLTNGEFAALADVSRVTVSMWINGKMHPHKLHANKIDKLVSAISRAVEAGEFPLSAKLTRPQRAREIRRIVLTHLKEKAAG